ncbi:MAG: winged helix-turn-helix domain-containing protein, partial [Blastocatellia bacterium]
MEPKLFDLLLLFVQNGGRVIEKAEIFERIWPGTRVEEVALHRNIHDLREALGDSAKKPCYIATVPTKGYRFEAEVKLVQINLSPAPTGTSDSALVTAQPKSRRPSVWLAVVAVAALAGVSFWSAWSIYRPIPIPAPILKLAPFTTFPGLEVSPALSPDGARVAFVWNGARGDNFDIYVKPVASRNAGDETPLRLTTDARRDDDPVWSPDGREIAFLRRSVEGGAFYAVSAQGGPERRLTEASSLRHEGWGRNLDWSPDGKSLAIVDKNPPSEPFSLFLISTEHGGRQRLTSPPATCVGDVHPAFSPDGQMVAFMRSCSNAIYDIYLAPARGGEPSQLTFDNVTITGLAWTPDSREIIFSSNRQGGFRLWQVAASGGKPQPLLAGAQNAVSPAVARQMARLVFSQEIEDT